MKEVFILKNVSAEHVDIIGVFATRESAEKCIISKGFVRSGDHYKKTSTSIPYAKFVRAAWIQKFPVMSGSNNGEFEEKTPIENRDAAVAEMVDQVTSCANKAAQQVMKDHKETFQKLMDK